MGTLLLVAFIVSTIVCSTRCFRTVCFYANSVQFRNSQGLLNPEDIDANLCTHLVYSYTTIKDIQNDLTKSNDDEKPWRKGIYSRFVQIKNDNSTLKLLLALVHANDGDELLSNVIFNQTMQQNFSHNVVQFIRSKHFDGLHLEWSEFAAKSQMKFLKLAQILNAAFDDMSTETQAKLILTVTLPAIKKQISDGNLIKILIKYVDFVTLRTIDLHTHLDKKVGLSSPLFTDSKDTGDDAFLSVNWVVTYYQSMGVPPAKMNIGISTYGRTFRLANAQKNRIGDVAVGPGTPGELTKTPGILAYYELCAVIRDGGQIINVDSQQGRYFVKDNQWISFEDTYSIMQKVCYMKRNGIGGLTIWTLDMDDFTGIGCNQGKFPLITTAVNTIRNADLSLCAPIDRHVYVDVPTLPPSSTTEMPKEDDEPKFKRVVCYVTNWAHYRHGKGKFLPESINPHICTHVVYAYAWIINGVISPITPDDPSENWREGMYHRVVKMKSNNPNLKILLAVGGYSAGPAGFENVSLNAETRKKFSIHAVKFLNIHRFDGLEVDWEYLSADYKMKNLLLFQALRLAFEDDARIRGTPRLLLTAALPANKKRIDDGYGEEVESLVKFTDYVSLLTYDFHGSWDVATNFNCPLFGNPNDSGERRYLNVDWVVKYYVSLGLPKHLINIGIATYGRSFTLRETQNNGVGAAVMRTGEPGPYTNRPGLLSYYEICDLITSGATVVRVNSQQAVYVYKDYQWIGYDDIDSITAKACYVENGGYGGVLLWSIDYDDFTGDSCNEGKFPLTTIVYTILQTSSLRVCYSFKDPSKAVSGTCLRLHGSSLLYLSLLLIWSISGLSFTRLQS